MAGVIKLNIISTAALPLFECPITCERFVDPVLADDGYTYEREAIVQWLRINNTSPITRQPMSVDTLRPNFIVKQLLELESRVERQQNKFKLNIDVRKKFNQPFMRTYDKQIYEAQWLNNQGPPVVILQINGARALKQASFYSKLTLHPNIVRTFGLVIDPNDALNNHCVMLLQEYATLGDLSNLLQNQPHPPNENVLIEMFIQITEAMCFLAEQNIVHGDLACRNILVFNYDENIPNNNLVKLTDFGLSRGSTIYTESATTSASTTMKIIPIRAAAPEVLEQQHSRSTSCYTEKADMFSMGVLMWEAYSKGSIPWVEESDDRRICSKVMNGERLSRPTNCSDRVWKIILKCMAQSPTNRPTFKDLKQLLLQLSLDRTSMFWEEHRKLMGKHH
jgi:serine/threonine protein kinase